MSDAWAWFSQFPPVSRTLAAGAFIGSLVTHAGLFSYKFYMWIPQLLFQRNPDPYQFITWFTCYFLTGARIGLLLDTYFLYRWSVQVEKSSRFVMREDYIWYLFCVGFFIHVLNYFFVGSAILLDGLILALCYTACQDDRNGHHMLFFFSVPAQMMPLAMIALTMLMQGSVHSAYLEFAGLVAAHMYDFLDRLWPEFGGGPKLIRTPSWVRHLATTPRFVQRAYGTFIQPTQQDEPRGSTTGANRGPFPDSWRTRGAGHRLGGS